MVSLRCKMMVKEELKKLGIQFVVVDLGVVEILEDITSFQFEELKNNLALSGLELLDDKKAILIQKIKNVIVEMVHYTEEMPKVNYSDYISEKLNYDYTYLSNIFSEVKGITIQQYIINHKIERAKELIYYITYTAYDGINALGSLVTSKDLITFERHGVIVPKFTFDEFNCLAGSNKLVNAKYFRHVRHFEPNKNVFLWDKDVIFFPRKIKGKFAFLHRIRPGIQLVLFDSLDNLTKQFWENYFLTFNEHIILDPIGTNHESSFIGGGCPPIETEFGWLLIYHGVSDTCDGYIYSAAAALLDIDDPTKVIARLEDPLFAPDLDFEKNGVVSNVVFPTGTSLFNDTLYIYYGAADKRIACVSVSLKELLKELLLNTTNYEN